MSAPAVTVRWKDPERHLEANWLQFWRYLASRGIEPFPAVQLCPCGFAEDHCACVRDERIAHETEVRR